MRHAADMDTTQHPSPTFQRLANFLLRTLIENGGAASLWGTEQRQRGSVTRISELPAFLAVHGRGCPSNIVEQCAGNRRYAEC
jgi:hypothetical protein